MKLHIKVLVFTVITRARRSSYDCNEKRCHPWVFSLLQCALSAPMAAPLTGFNAVFFWERRVAPRLASSLTSCQQPPKDTRPNKGRKYLWEKKKCLWLIRGVATVAKTLPLVRSTAEEKVAVFFFPPSPACHTKVLGKRKCWHRKKKMNAQINEVA